MTLLEIIAGCSAGAVVFALVLLIYRIRCHRKESSNYDPVFLKIQTCDENSPQVARKETSSKKGLIVPPHERPRSSSSASPMITRKSIKFYTPLFRRPFATAQPVQPGPDAKPPSHKKRTDAERLSLESFSLGDSGTTASPDSLQSTKSDRTFDFARRSSVDALIMHSVHSVLNLSKPPTAEDLLHSRLGWINFSTAYDAVAKVLEVKVIAARHLAAKDISGTSDPYVVIRLFPSKDKLRTAVRRKQLNPIWNEVFQFQGYTPERLKSRSLILKVMDQDRFSRDDPIGEAVVPLSGFVFDEPCTVWKELKTCEAHKKLGEIDVGLEYNPDLCQLRIYIYCCRDLPPRDVNLSSGAGLMPRVNRSSDPYVKIWFIHQGEKKLKQKTDVKKKSLNPVFNQNFEFSLESSKLRDSGLFVSVMDYDTYTKNDQIGGIYLSSRSGSLETLHWRECYSKPFVVVNQTHQLKPLGRLESSFKKMRPTAVFFGH